MNDYVIGAGAVLTAGPTATIGAASLHAQTDPAIAGGVRAALLDFESPSQAELSKVVIVATGWNARRVEAEIVRPLLTNDECTLVEVLARLARAAGTAEVHLFARWLPDEVMTAALRRVGVTLVVHAIESIRQAALITGETYSRWVSPLRAA
ncbi:MAG: hypothetical protein KGN02_01485 [bacterium]|nr:hypothetical protein [bacterium]